MQLPRLQSIMTRLQHLMLSSLPCMGCHFSTDNFSLITFSVLHPQMKMKHFKKHWSTDLQVKVKDAAEEVVSLLLSVPSQNPVLINCLQCKQHYKKLNSDLATPAQAKKGHSAASNMKKLLCQL